MAEARVVRPDRRQLRWDMIDLEGLLPADHRARLVWSFVESLDLSPLYDQVLSREGEAGRPAADPAVLLSLWLYATIEGVGSARELERLAQSDAAYRWLAGGVPVNYHGLADFRVEQVDVLDRLLTQSVTALTAQWLISLDEISVVGTKRHAGGGEEGGAGFADAPGGGGVALARGGGRPGIKRQDRGGAEGGDNCLDGGDRRAHRGGPGGGEGRRRGPPLRRDTRQAAGRH